MKILVMGGSRFVGIHVVNRLMRLGHDVTVFNRGTHPASWADAPRVIRGDRNRAQDLQPLCGEDFEAVIDISAYNAMQTEQLLDVLCKTPYFIHVSTSAVYSRDALSPVSESSAYCSFDQCTEYAAHKIACELILRDRRDPTTSTVCIRIPYVLGPGNYIPRENFVFSRLADNATILLPGDGLATVQFVYVQQAADAICNCLQSLNDPGWRAVNVADPTTATPLAEFVEQCASIAGCAARVIPIGGGPSGELGVPFDYYNCIFPFPNETSVMDCTFATESGVLPPPMGLPAMLGIAYKDFLQSGPREWQRTDAELRILERIGPN